MFTGLGAEKFLPKWGVLAPIVLLLVVGMFYGWQVVSERALGSFGGIPLEFMIPALVLPILAVYVIGHNERLWIYISLCMLAVFVFREDDAKVGLEEVAYMAFVSAGLVVWFAKEMMVLRRRIVLTGFDLLLLTSWILTNIIAAIGWYVHGGDATAFLKELLYHQTMLLYFPIRNTMTERKYLLRMISVILVLGVINAVNNLVTYQERVVESALEFGMVGARVASFEVLGTVMVIVGFTILAYAKKPWTYVLGLGGMAIGVASVVMSLSRGPIFASLLGMLVIIALVPAGKSIKLIGTAIITLILNLVALSILAPTFAESILDNIEDRISSVGKLDVDKSLDSRVAESEALLEYIPKSPMIGYGYGVQYKFFDDPYSFTAKVLFIHNGYLYPFYKYGIPLGLLFLSVFFYPLVAGVVNAPPKNAGFLRALMVGASGMMVTLMATNLTSCKFEDHVDSAVFAMTFAVFTYVRLRTVPEGEYAEEKTLNPETA